MASQKGWIWALGLFCLGACSVPEVEYPQPAPVIERFEATPFVVKAGQPIEIIWRAKDAEQLTLKSPWFEDRPLSEAQGRLGLVPTQSGQIILEAQGPGGTAQASVAVEIGQNQRLRILHFQATPEQIDAGDAIRLTWRTEGATKVTLSHSPGIIISERLPAVGARIIKPSRDTEYTLIAEGLGGPLHRSVKVDIRSPQPQISVFEAALGVIGEGRDGVLRWSVERAEHLALYELTAEGPQVIIEGTRAHLGNEYTVQRPVGRHRFRLVAENEAGRAQRDTSLFVVGRQTPTIQQLTVTPTVTGPGGQTILRWQSNAEEDINLSYNGAFPDKVAPNGSLLVSPQEENNIYRVFFVDGVRVASATVSVSIDSLRPSIDSFRSRGLGPFYSAQNIELLWQVRNAQQISLRNDTGTVLATNLVESGQQDYSAEYSTTLVLRAHNSFGTTERWLPLSIGPPPRIIDFRSDVIAVRRNHPFWVRWSSENSERGQLSSSQGGRALDSDELDQGQAVVRINAEPGPANVVLSAQNAYRTVSATIAVQIYPESVGDREQEPNHGAELAHRLPVLPYSVRGSLDGDDQDSLLLFANDRPFINLFCDGPTRIHIFRLVADQTRSLEGMTLEPTVGQDCPSWPRTDLAVLGGQLLVSLEPLQSQAPGQSISWRLEAALDGQTCSDGIVDYIEECDDGNTFNGDGCSSSCLLEDLDESLHNDRRSIASNTHFGSTSAFLRPSDTDWFRLDVDSSRAGPATLVIRGQTASGDPRTIDAMISLYDVGGKLLASAGKDGLGNPMLSGAATVLEAGTYFIEVRAGMGRYVPHRGHYQLDILGRP